LGKFILQLLRKSVFVQNIEFFRRQIGAQIVLQTFFLFLQIHDFVGLLLFFRDIVVSLRGKRKSLDDLFLDIIGNLTVVIVNRIDIFRVLDFFLLGGLRVLHQKSEVRLNVLWSNHADTELRFGEIQFRRHDEGQNQTQHHGDHPALEKAVSHETEIRCCFFQIVPEKFRHFYSERFKIFHDHTL